MNQSDEPYLDVQVVHEDRFGDGVVHTHQQHQALLHGLVQRNAVRVLRLHAHDLPVLVLHHHHLLRPTHSLHGDVDHLLGQARVGTFRLVHRARHRAVLRLTRRGDTHCVLLEPVVDGPSPRLPEVHAELQHLAVGTARQEQHVLAQLHVELRVGLQQLAVQLADTRQEQRQPVDEIRQLARQGVPHLLQVHLDVHVALLRVSAAALFYHVLQEAAQALRHQRRESRAVWVAEDFLEACHGRRAELVERDELEKHLHQLVAEHTLVGKVFDD